MDVISLLSKYGLDYATPPTAPLLKSNFSRIMGNLEPGRHPQLKWPAKLSVQRSKQTFSLDNDNKHFLLFVWENIYLLDNSHGVHHCSHSISPETQNILPLSNKSMAGQYSVGMN